MDTSPSWSGTQTPVWNLQCPPQLQSGLRKQGASLHLQIQYRKLKFGIYVCKYYIHILIMIRNSNPRQEPPVSTTTLVRTWEYRRLLWTFNFNLGSSNLVYRSVDRSWTHPQGQCWVSKMSLVSKRYHLDTIFCKKKRYCLDTIIKQKKIPQR